ncbi:MAG: TatD family hydrolase [Bradymonadaceae bacterium]
MRLFDTHAHLDFETFDGRVGELLERAQRQNVERVVTIGASDGLASNERALKIARNYESVRCTAGIHPHDADQATDEAIETIREEYAERDEVVAIGETGLDYHYDNSERDNQRRAFRAFLEMADEVDKPVVVHSREAEVDTLDIIESSDVREGILHCFAGSREMAEQVLEMGFHISFSGIATFGGSDELREIAADVPDDRILIETDSPFLAPAPKRGDTNEPAYVRHTAETIAEARDESLETLAEKTWRNACRIYNWETTT